ncbi:c-type cytochrome domain-containing protein [Flagellimonas myxillae]|uniref:c-type cytochrome domain-containing protein n=1 Tax=Flagellimonas myxillae TaxID=2942214 RepID=UPI00201E7EE7|nr:c-type cytochrome domain-containing protein [Muricauda myxillae]MCL6266320.1 hypothetical protein [Muricauda myxillae]
MNETSDIILFLGRFHPMVVHLPIGFLLFAFILEVLSRWKKNPALAIVVPLALLLGAISALVACILGYLLSLSGDYEQGALDIHFWFGIITTIIAFMAWLISANKVTIPKLQHGKPYLITLTVVIVLVGITGHYGGNLTHGADYLTAYLPFGQFKKEKLAPVATVEEAGVFAYLVDPILEDKCVSCHNASKKKGKLSFANVESLLKGGESGPAFVAGNPSASEMIRRVLLNPEDEEVMPPEGKTPLTEEEIAILNFWIQTGNGSFETKMGELEVSEEVQTIASTMLGLTPNPGELMLAPGPVVADSTLNKLQDYGFKIRELVAGTNLFDVAVTSNNPKITATTMPGMIRELALIKSNIIWLSLPDNKVNDDDLKTIATFENLRKLRLEKNPITDIGVGHLSTLQNLESLNLYQTKITQKSIPVFSSMQNLQSVYVWGTEIQQDEFSKKGSDRLEIIL